MPPFLLIQLLTASACAFGSPMLTSLPRTAPVPGPTSTYWKPSFTVLSPTPGPTAPPVAGPCPACAGPGAAAPPLVPPVVDDPVLPELPPGCAAEEPPPSDPPPAVVPL